MQPRHPTRPMELCCSTISFPCQALAASSWPATPAPREQSPNIHLDSTEQCLREECSHISPTEPGICNIFSFSSCEGLFLTSTDKSCSSSVASSAGSVVCEVVCDTTSAVYINFLLQCNVATCYLLDTPTVGRTKGVWLLKEYLEKKKEKQTQVERHSSASWYFYENLG